MDTGSPFESQSQRVESIHYLCEAKVVKSFEDNRIAGRNQFRGFSSGKKYIMGGDHIKSPGGNLCLKVNMMRVIGLRE